MKNVTLNLNLTVSDDKFTILLDTLKELGADVDNDDFVPLDDVVLEVYEGLNSQEVIGQYLRSARLDAGLTQVALAERVGVHKQNISAMENGKRPIGKVLAKKFADTLDLNYKIFL
jgi:DNA-binding XRE family transcriptional regulator